MTGWDALTAHKRCWVDLKAHPLVRKSRAIGDKLLKVAPTVHCGRATGPSGKRVGREPVPPHRYRKDACRIGAGPCHDSGRQIVDGA